MDFDGYDMIEITWYYLANVFNHMPSLSDTKDSHPYATCLEFDVSFCASFDMCRHFCSEIFQSISISILSIHQQSILKLFQMLYVWHDHDMIIEMTRENNDFLTFLHRCFALSQQGFGWCSGAKGCGVGEEGDCLDVKFHKLVLDKFGSQQKDHRITTKTSEKNWKNVGLLRSKVNIWSSVSARWMVSCLGWVSMNGVRAKPSRPRCGPKKTKGNFWIFEDFSK